MSNPKVLFIDNAHPLLSENLTALGFQCDYFEHFARSDYESVIHNYEGVIIRSKIKIDKSFLQKAENLKFIGRVGSGMENIDVSFAESKGIRCINAPEGNRSAVGEHTLGLLLMLLNNLAKADKEVRQGLWIRKGNTGIEIEGKTIGIIGYGNMGSAFAKRLSGFGAKVIAYDKYKFGYADQYVKEAELEELFKYADIVSLHVPLTPETEYMVDEKFIDSFQKPIYLINTARGKVVNTEALVKHLKSGKIKGAALDVLEYENYSFENIENQNIPNTFKYLIDADNVVLSPHIAGWSHESAQKMAEVIVEKIKAIYSSNL